MIFGINIAIILGFLFAVIFPLILLLWWKIKTKEKLWCFIAGAICFTVFAYGLENLVHQFCLFSDNPFSRAVTSSPVLYMLYGSFMAGIFEETARLFGFKVLLRKHNEKDCAVAYGIGHGGIEVILVLGVTYLVYLLALCGIPFGDEATTASVVETAKQIPVSTIMVAAFERVSAVMLHIGLSLIMFVAAKEKGKLWLYPVSILLHAMADAPACLYQYQIIKSISVVEAVIFVFAVIVLIAGVSVIKKYNNPYASPVYENDTNNGEKESAQ